MGESVCAGYGDGTPGEFTTPHTLQMRAGDYQLSLETECQCWNVMTWTLQYGSSTVNSLHSVQEYFKDASIWVSH